MSEKVPFKFLGDKLNTKVKEKESPFDPSFEKGDWGGIIKGKLPGLFIPIPLS
ncbi:hypothetical protein KSU1_B0336 [Candidatus Jettenia caeni]|uniref:Uncharacterized protein n=1 Tax=Candidatus Jettenia caeni TaxID=247490 RepID=I3IHJ8_9BACT|nr:hypothetical protein KSU1_B0336 [Candidatus Jettenia caeni]